MTCRLLWYLICVGQFLTCFAGAYALQGHGLVPAPGRHQAIQLTPKDAGLFLHIQVSLRNQFVAISHFWGELDAIATLRMHRVGRLVLKSCSTVDILNVKGV